ncbi:MAG: hypothetical protein A3E84_03225 [Gammaproteobacteria bacterium RIFCSPHIGHO2_12_FULL_42_13]|nr:MAG: hypothetical protein A3E84_03225 [Gammaproteobacteria bacterium RIFCSPHIGHO2_12_FULL_42_13]
MTKLHAILGILILAMCTALNGWANPCRPIAEACMQAGYYKGGNNVGKGLVKNCVMPIVENKKSLPSASFSQTTLQQCRTELMQKMSENQ